MAVEKNKLMSWGSHYQCNCNAKIKKFKLNLKRETSANNGILPVVEIVWRLYQVSNMKEWNK